MRQMLPLQQTVQTVQTQHLLNLTHQLTQVQRQTTPNGPQQLPLLLGQQVHLPLPHPPHPPPLNGPVHHQSMTAGTVHGE